MKKGYLPTTEYNELSDKDFDKRFEIDRVYAKNSFFINKRIRFVKYPSMSNDDSIHIYKIRFLLPFLFRMKLYGFEYKFRLFLTKYCYSQKETEMLIKDAEDKYKIDLHTDYKLQRIKKNRKDKIKKILI